MRIEFFDFLRGILLIAMIFFHANYMAIHLFDFDLQLFSNGTWAGIGYVIGMSFITLSGYVNALGYRHRNLRKNIIRGLYRGGFFALVAAMISIVTYTFFPEQRISWGIIHFFALASFLQPFFSKLGGWIIPSIAMIFLMSDWVTNITVQSSYFVPLGLYPPLYFSADYYPLLPWFGYILLGQGMQFLFSKFGIEKTLSGKGFPRFTLLRMIGKHSLLVYILHTPLLYILFSCIFGVLS